MRTSSLWIAALCVLVLACSQPDDQVQEGACQIATGSVPDSLSTLTCQADFLSLSSDPLDTSLPGAQSGKVVLDQSDNNALYFQNSKKFKIHYEFASTHLSGNGHPIITSLSEFNTVQYFAPDRRFLLGAVTYYSGPQVWALEIAGYDTASADMIALLYQKVKKSSYFGPKLLFHPTSDSVAVEAKKLPASVPVITTDELYAGIDYQPLNLGTAVGRLHFVNAADLATTYLGYREIVVLDHVPNDISVVQGIITEEFQTPLSHVNVLSQNRHNPNMGLRNATRSDKLLALKDKWVKLEVTALAWTVSEVSQAEADAWWQTHKPTPVVLPAANLTVTNLVDVENVTNEGTGTLRDALKAAVLAFGGKAAHYSILAKTKGVPLHKAFAIPVVYYYRFMTQNGLFAQLDALMASTDFQNNPATRDAKLAAFRTAIQNGTVEQSFQDALKAKLAADYPGLDMRFRSSTNSEDLDGFPCAGCYESHTGKANNWTDVLDAIRTTWSSAFLFRTFEERTYYSIDHKSVVMALLVHQNFPTEEANGVALTSNPYDPSGLQPGFYINVQAGGDAEVVHPPAGVTSDQFIYQFDQPGQPISYIAHSNVVLPGTTVLTRAQTYQLGQALDLIHQRFSAAYGPAAGVSGWYAMDVEFKFDGDTPETATLYVKQARSNPGRGN